MFSTLMNCIERSFRSVPALERLQSARTAAGPVTADGAWDAVPAQHLDLRNLSTAIDVCQLLDERWRGSPLPSSPDTEPQAVEPSRPRRRAAGGNGGGGSRESAAAARGPPGLAIVPPPPEAFAIQDLPGIGTWAGRQRLFGPAYQPPEDPPLAPVAGAGTIGVPVPSPARVGPAARVGSEEQAWRWRFTRKWRAEQDRFADGQEPAAGSREEADAMDWVTACGAGVSMQVTHSQPRPATLVRADSDALPLQGSASTLSLCQFDVESSLASVGATLGAASQPSTSPGAALAPPRPRPSLRRVPSATSKVLAMAKRGEGLLQVQEQLETEAQARWEHAADLAGWAGAALPAVCIDKYGRFGYLLCRIAEGGAAGRRRFLVRGRNGADPGVLFAELAQQVARACKDQGHPSPDLEVVGAGAMAWREDTGRHLALSPPPCRPGWTALPGIDRDLAGLTASLVRAGLPAHFKISYGENGAPA